jgi:hypothetical protein
VRPRIEQISRQLAVGASANVSSGHEITEQLAHAYATPVETCERVVDEVG